MLAVNIGLVVRPAREIGDVYFSTETKLVWITTFTTQPVALAGINACCGFVVYASIFPLYKSEIGKIKS